MSPVSVLIGVELADLQGMNANPDAGHAVAHLRHRRRFVAAMRWVAAIGVLVVYLRGIRFLLDQGAQWVITCGQIVRRMLGCP